MSSKEGGKGTAALQGNGLLTLPHQSRRAVKAGDRIAQLILERIVNPEITHVQSLDETERGQGGFGHTGGFGGNAVSTAGNIAGNVAATAAGSLGQVAGFVGGAANDVADAVKPKQ